MNFQRTITIDKPIAEAWELLGPQYGKACEWAPGVHGSALRGIDQATDSPTHRACATDLGDIREEVTEYDPGSYTLAYRVIEGFPGMIKEGRNRWQLRELGPDKTQLTMHMTINTGGVIGTLMRPVMRMKLNATADQAVEGFKHYAETGQPSPAKRKEAKKRRAVAL